ncbi:hypothetical protein LTR37_002536 [Vermiconidia calcicola]|uniref:Uncharacterized protein n=1 Tax=Vermiconidia calcicola TaxID=1690605 RepID=A0ACC3NTF4_9PEZI|nr:hypothetical protein LTR37_002536 [Vermiconidia calcicola]
MAEVEVPSYIVEWTQALEFDPLQTPADQITLLTARTASIRAAFRTGSKSDEQLAELAATLEEDLLSWSERTLATGSVCAFHTVRDPNSPHSWNGNRHVYKNPQAYRHWNKWRCLRVLLSRTQEALWRRSWPVLVRSHRIHDSEHYKSIRNEMVAELCIASAWAFGNDPLAEPTKGSISYSYLMVMGLTVAGTCLLELLALPIRSPDGNRMILVNEPLHTDPFSQTSTQLAWVIERLDYIADKVGIRWAAPMSKFLKGDAKIYFDLSRSRVVNNEELEEALYGQTLSLDEMVNLWVMEDP